MKEEYLSAKFEPAHRQGSFEADPSEERAAAVEGGQDEIAEIRDSVANEPAITLKQDQVYLGDWLAQKRAGCSMAGNLGVAFLAAILAGPFAVLGAFMAGSEGWYGLAYVLVAAPIIEEFLKQSGMIYLLEAKPYRVFAAWQFVFSAVVAALVFATIENLLYVHVYLRPAAIARPEVLINFRWTVCTAIHVGCSIIASLGMIRVWRKQLADGKAADISAAYSLFATAMVVHGLYNLTATFFNKYFVE